MTRKRRRLAVRSALAAVVLGAVAGGVYYSTSAATAGQTPVAASFSCALPGGQQVAVPIEFGVSVPDTATAGTATTITPSAKVTLPAAAVTALRGTEATTVDATLTPKLELTDASGTSEVKANPLAIKAMALPAEGELVLPLAGTPVQVTPSGAGTAQIQLTGLTAQLAAGERQVECTSSSNTGALGSFEVGATKATPTQQPQQRVQAAPGGGVSAQAGFKVNFDVTVTTTLKKVDNAQVVLTGTLKSELPVAPPPPEGNPLTGELTLNPVKDNYLVVFRFMPVFNDITATSDGPVTGRVFVDVASGTADTKAVSKVVLKIDRVRQGSSDPNGGVLVIDKGVNCRTASPIEVPISGKIGIRPGTETEISTKATIPPFAGCTARTGEDMSRLFTGLVSGPDTPVVVKLKSLCLGDCPA
ncbi:hypothetical protein BJP25_22400 [Actinokineospora bangkokensis]|uniref:Tat pathway signal sequence domain protein n=1 Tax=Actinokineospora bangkokensis TaxID=1193682 RepID=A0A1Q9LJB6_9PSEU|nr:hypothetical protein BJP25_22400 [Actinokineospora bangkokensis]